MGPWGRDQIVGHYQAKPTAWPDPVKQVVRALTQEVHQASRRGERVPFNGLGYQLTAFDVSQRTVPDEAPLLHLHFRPTDYFTMLATDQRLDARLMIGGQETTLRQEYAAQVDLRQRPVTAFATHFGVAVQIITADGLTLVTERGHTAVDAHVLFPSVAEGASRPVDGDDRQVPHPTRTAMRGLAEEWAVVVEPDKVHWVSFGANAVLCEYGLLGWVALKETWATLERRRAAGVPQDLWEAARVHAIPFQPQAIATFVAEHQPWSPFALATLYHTLLGHF